MNNTHLAMRERLTQKQEYCFCLFSQNYSAKQAAQLLGKQEEGVRGLYKSAMKRLGLNSGYTPVDFVRNNGLRSYVAEVVSRLELSFDRHMMPN